MHDLKFDSVGRRDLCGRRPAHSFLGCWTTFKLGVFRAISRNLARAHTIPEC